MSANLDENKNDIEAAKTARERIRYWKGVQEQAEERIAEALGDETEGTVAGEVVVRYSHRSRVVWDGDKLKEFLGTAINEYRRTTHFRQFDYKDES